MNKKSTSTQEIIKISKEIVRNQGIQEINMRKLAKQCHVALGSLYNYYPSKTDLMIAVVESIWEEIMLDFNHNYENKSFLENVKALFETIKRGHQKYPSFLTLHSMTITHSHVDKGRLVMDEYFKDIKNQLIDSIHHDQDIDYSFFSKEVTEKDFVDFVFINVLSLLNHHSDNCDLLLHVIKSSIYK